jgi:hypothetical protein
MLLTHINTLRLYPLVGAVYISETTTMQQRTLHLAKYRITQSVARMLGPFVAYLTLFIEPIPSENADTVQKLFNW